MSNLQESEDVIDLHTTETSMMTAIMCEDLNTINDLFEEYTKISTDSKVEYFGILCEAITNQKENSLICVLELLKKRYADAVNHRFRYYYTECLKDSIEQCILLQYYNLLYNVVLKFDAHNLLKQICLDLKTNIDLEKIYHGSIKVPLEISFEIAIYRGDIQYVKNHVIDIDLFTNGKYLKIAIQKEYVNIVLLLVNSGANVNHPGNNYLLRAIGLKNFKIVKILIEAGIELGNNLFKIPENTNENQIIDLLLNQNIDPLIMAYFFYCNGESCL